MSGLVMRLESLGKATDLPLALKIGSWICAIFVIFTALVWLIGGFLVTSKMESDPQSIEGLSLVPQLFWPVRAIVSALGLVGAVILVLSRPAFFRVLVVWFASELALVGWLYATGFLVYQLDSAEAVRSLVILQMCSFSVVLFAWVKHNSIYRSQSIQR